MLKMKKVFSLVLFLLLFLPYLNAQNTDRFESVDKMIGKTIRLYGAEELYDSYGPFAYNLVNNKPNKLKDITVYTSELNRVFRVLSIEQLKRKSYLRLQDEGAEYYLILDDNINYLNNIRSLSYWEDLYAYYQNKYGYVDTNDAKFAWLPKTEAREAGHYMPIKWNGFDIPKNVKDDVQFHYLVAYKEYTINSNALKSNIEKFISKDDYSNILLLFNESKRRQEHADSITDLTPISADVKHSVATRNKLKEYGIDYDSDDKTLVCHPYQYSTYFGNKFASFIFGKVIYFGSDEIEFHDPSKKDYLIRRGENGYAGRRDVAEKADSLYVEHYIDELEEESLRISERMRKLVDFYGSKKIVILQRDYVYAEYGGQFGLRFKFYNPYKKVIKYINVKVNAYNQVGDLQRDDIGRNTAEVRCIGPIGSGDVAVFEFEKMFWDDDDIINRLTPVKMTITFMDNTTVTFSGASQIEQHSASHYSLADAGISE